MNHSRRKWKTRDICSKIEEVYQNATISSRNYSYASHGCWFRLLKIAKIQTSPTGGNNMFSDKLKNLRKQAKMSQEQLAEKLNVSRQAVTKWETNAGTPDIVNLSAIANLFHLSLDELLDNEYRESQRDYMFESITEYDIDYKKNFDISLISSKKTVIIGYEGEKIKVRLAADQIPDIQKSFKVKVDDVKQTIDINVEHHNGMSATEAKEKLVIFIYLPLQYVMNVEISNYTEQLEIINFNAESLEYSGKVKQVLINTVQSHLEFNTNEDTEIICEQFTGLLDMNQISATSKLLLPFNYPFITVKKGIANTIHYKQNGIPTEDFSLKCAAKSCENVIELNGMKSELTIEFYGE